MGKYDKLYQHILMKQGDSNVSFGTLCKLLTKLGFDSRVKGDHHIFWMESVEEILNLQPLGTKAKAYQVKQVRNVILKYSLHLGE
ncbi:MAG: type II toxin-antitoxin system HicA family toxin [Kiritimatiellales bacterium]|nr:type II toxin-antitoxin system HicA family toxin [Kiritimatiellota bacterium]MBL7011408.1 type II toxin-antitoxin system HicA family toxin [Kiritimatiellales bacterium]